jgi:hypothetical protein
MFLTPAAVAAAAAAAAAALCCLQTLLVVCRQIWATLTQSVKIALSKAREVAELGKGSSAEGPAPAAAAGAAPASGSSEADGGDSSEPATPDVPGEIGAVLMLMLALGACMDVSTSHDADAGARGMYGCEYFSRC